MDGIIIRLSKRRKRKFRQRARKANNGDLSRRYWIVLNLAEGCSLSETARRLGASRHTVRAVARRFCEQGEAGLVDRREDNGQGKVDEDFLGALAELVASRASDHGWRRPTWTQEMLRETMEKKTGVGVSVGTISRALKRLGARWGQPKPTVACPWPKGRKQRRLPAIGRLLRNLPPEAAKAIASENGAVSPVSQLDSYLYVYDGNRQLLAQSDDGGGGLNSRVTVNVTAGQAYYVKAAAYGSSSGAYTLQIGMVQIDPNHFNIEMSLSGLTQAQQDVVQQAAHHWEQIIVGDIPDADYNGQFVDDLQIDVSAVAMDGPGGALAGASATDLRVASFLPYRGFIRFDAADLAWLQDDGSLLAVVEHEMAHVLGFGVIWDDLGLLAGVGTSDLRFTGQQATTEYNRILGSSDTSVPVEAGGGSGTRVSHCRETVFDTEMMTGWLDSGQANPLSRITVASMADLG
jgi:transposase